MPSYYVIEAIEKTTRLVLRGHYKTESLQEAAYVATRLTVELQITAFHMGATKLAKRYGKGWFRRLDKECECWQATSTLAWKIALLSLDYLQAAILVGQDEPLVDRTVCTGLPLSLVNQIKDRATALGLSPTQLIGGAISMALAHSIGTTPFLVFEGRTPKPGNRRGLATKHVRCAPC